MLCSIPSILFALALLATSCGIQVEILLAEESLSLGHWCDFRAIAAVSRGEPLVMRGAFPTHEHWFPSRLMQPPNMSQGSSPKVSIEFTNGTRNFMPHSAVTQSTAFMRWDDALRLLEGKSSVRNGQNYSFYMQQQAIFPEGHSDSELDQLVADMPRCLQEMLPLSSIMWLSGQTPVSSYLHFDGLDNIMVLLSGQKKFVLYPPWEIARISCGRKIVEFYFLEERYDFKQTGDAGEGEMKFPSIPQWMRDCESFSQVDGFEVTVMPGDILWIPRGWFHTVLSMPGTAALSFFFTNYSPLGDVPGALTMRSMPASDEAEQAIEYFRDSLFRQFQQAYPQILLQDDEQSPHVTQLALPVRKAFHRAVKARAKKHSTSLGLWSAWQWPSPSQWKSELKSSQFQNILQALASDVPRDVASIEGVIGGPPLHQQSGRQWLRMVLQSLASEGVALSHVELMQRLFPGCSIDDNEFSCGKLLQEVSAVAGKFQTCPLTTRHGQEEL